MIFQFLLIIYYRMLMKTLMRGAARLFSTGKTVTSKKGQISQVGLELCRSSVLLWMCSFKERFHPFSMLLRLREWRTDLCLRLLSISETLG